jgi:hypothetical protein
MMRPAIRGIGLWLVLFWAAVPVRAGETTWYGGIEIGSKGIKMVAIPVDSKTGKIDLAKRKEASNTGKVDPDPAKQIQGLKIKKVADVGLVNLKDGNFRPEALEEAREAVEGFYAYLSGDLKIPPSQICVVTSSGLTAEEPKNFDALVAAVAKATGGEVPLQRITQRTEVELMIRGAVPRKFLDDAILLDVGSGNAKVGYHEPANGLNIERFQVLSSKVEGTTTFGNKVRALRDERKLKGFKEFARVAKELREERVEHIKDDINGKAGLVNQPHVFLSGGVAWAILTLTNPEASVSQDLYVEFPLKDIRAFHDELVETGEIPKEPELDGLQKSVQDKAMSELRSVRRFSKEDLLAGSEILLAFAEALEFDQPKKKIYFTKSGVVAWIVGFIEQERLKPAK